MNEQHPHEQNKSFEKLERQKEFLKALGLDSVAELLDVIADIDENLEKAEKDSEVYYKLLEQKNYFEEGLKQFEEEA